MSTALVQAPAPAHVERLGVWRAAELLAEVAGIEVYADDVHDLTYAQLLTVTARFKGNDVWDVAALRELAGQPDFAQLLGEHRMLTTRQAATYLEIRPSDFGYVVAAGWICPTTTRWRTVGRRKEIEFPLWHKRDLDAVRCLPGVNWEAVRAVKRGQRSPLRAYVDIPPTRAQIIRWFCTKLSHRYKVQVWAFWNNAADTWHIDWDTRNSKPSIDTVGRSLARDKVARQFKNQIQLGVCESAAVARWARDMLIPGAAVILDTETTGLPGRVCELAVIDAATGETLLNTLVNPGVPIEPEAQAVHGISDEAVAGAPTFDQVWPALLEVTKGRTVLAYNSDFDQDVVCGHAEALGLDPGRLARRKTWGCIMVNRTAWLRQWKWVRLDGGHRALGDTLKARDVLLEMTAPAT